VTADRLARHYPSLKPDERLALMLAASARGDDVEHERLTAAAPRVAFTTLHTFPRDCLPRSPRPGPGRAAGPGRPVTTPSLQPW